MGFAFFSEASPGKTLASRNKNRKAHNLGLKQRKNYEISNIAPTIPRNSETWILFYEFLATYQLRRCHRWGASPTPACKKPKTKSKCRVRLWIDPEMGHIFHQTRTQATKRSFGQLHPKNASMTLLASRTFSGLARVAKASSSTARLAASSCQQRQHQQQYVGSRFLSTAETPLTREDVMDNRGLLQFKTLHEMNCNAAIAFRDNPLFGTYKATPVANENVLNEKEDAKGKFEWMTYGEYGDLVNRCRTVLKDIGE